MILYNIRKNGPYEYDKFVLNIYQIMNDTRDKQVEIEKNIKNIQDKLDTVNTIYENIQKDVNKTQTLMRTYLY